ncbi:uncharacterized protein LOC126965089 [Leptidea sinapis]|uniref:uncharacterized protein LOC126965089 n=1 Tax=Leptidea sinapis TaxID=189913 RepID=UPI00212C684D|nr:uncharacterized protein LOC126965089 [Leptidea sinapis]
MTLKINAETNYGDSEPCVAAWSNKLFVGTENGFIASFNPDLSPATKWAAHEVQIFALAANDSSVFSASNDGNIRVWNTNGEKIKEIPTSGSDIESLFIHGKNLYSGDEAGNVFVFENNEPKAAYSVLEEVKDIKVNLPYMFTARDLYVTVTEIKPEESKDRFVTRHVMEGRAPLALLQPYLLTVARGGYNLQLHDLSFESRFKKLHEIKASDMIVTSLSAIDTFAWTGGWDGIVRRWKIADNKIEAAGEINLGCCVNALVATTAEDAYAILTGGRIVHVKSE